MTQEFPNQTSSPLWTSESVRLEKLAWRQELGRRAIARSRMNRVCLMLLIWLAVFSQLSSTGVVLLSFLQLDIPAWLTGVGRLAAACGTVGLVLIWKRRPFWQNVMFARSGRPRAGEVLLWVLCLLALQGAAGLLQSLLSPAMEFFRTKSKVVSGTAETSVSLALYTAVAAPVTEELLFRGAVLRSLQPYGKRFAIFCSALLFGLVHQNLTQTPFAFGFGLLAGYVAMEYSILWSMSLHILNNAVLALGLDALLRPLSGTWYWLAIRGVLFLLPLAVCLVLALVFRKKLAARLIGQFGSLGAALSASPEELASVEGMDASRALLLRLVTELHRRYYLSRPFSGARLTGTTDFGNFLLPFFYGAREELVYLLALDAAGRLLTCTCLSEGSVNSANVPMRKLMRAALSANASGVVLAHNHPAGIALPSHEDVELTRRLQQALDVVDILLLDHLVIADDDFVSLRDSGYLR